MLDVRTRDTDTEIVRPEGTRLRPDLGIPVLVVNSETETPTHHKVRQSDTDELRLWEVAGSAHATTPEMELIVGKVLRDELQLPMPEEQATPMPPMCEVAWRPVLRAGLDHLQRWVRGGPPPPSQPPITVSDGGDIARDEHGIAIGGIRLPQVQVPLAAHTGVNGLPGMAVLTGASVPFPPELVSELYPDRASYLERFEAAVQRALADGVLLSSDADALRDEASRRAAAVIAG